MSTREKKRSRSENKRAQIRTAAYQCFRDQSYNEASVDMICRRAGISKGSFYWHYESKHEVFVDILETWTREVMDELLQQFELVIEAKNRYQAIATALSKEVHRGRAIVPLWLEFTILARRDPEIKVAISRFYRRARAAISETLRPHVEGLSEVEIQGLAATILAAYIGLVVQDLCDSQWANAEHMLLRSMAVVGRIMRVYSESRGGSDELQTPPPTELLQQPPVPPDETRRADKSEARALLQSSPKQIRTLAEILRRLILDAAPEAHERIISGWRVFAYSLPTSKLFVYVKPRRADAQIGFYFGVDLDDPEGLLSGQGKQRRHINVSSLDDVDQRALRALVGAAQVHINS